MSPVVSASTPAPLSPPAPERISRAPLFLLAGCHGSLHWVLATFYVLLPFIQRSLGLSYAEAGLLASVVHFTSFASNVPSGALVDMSGRRVACQLASLLCASLAILALGFSDSFWMVAAMTGVLAAMNTLWHPAAISYLSDRYREQRGLALSFHTVGASIGDALAPLAIGAVITLYGWQAATLAAAGPPLVAALAVVLMLRSTAGRQESSAPRTTRGFGTYVNQLRLMLSNSAIWVICMLAGLRGTAQVGLRTFVPLFVVNELGASAVWVGITLLAFQGAGALGTPFAGAASDRFGRAPILVAGLGLTAVFIAVLPAATDIRVFTLLVALTGAALLTLRPVIQGWALDQTPPEMGGSAISVLFTMQAAFGMTVPIVGGLIADGYGLDATFRLLAAMAALACAATFLAARFQRRLAAPLPS